MCIHVYIRVYSTLCLQQFAAQHCIVYVYVIYLYISSVCVSVCACVFVRGTQGRLISVGASSGRPPVIYI